MLLIHTNPTQTQLLINRIALGGGLLLVYLSVFQLSELVGDNLDLLQGDGEALDQVSHHIHVTYLEVLFLAISTKRYLGANEHPLQIPPVIHQGVLQLVHFHFLTMLLVSWAI